MAKRQSQKKPSLRKAVILRKLSPEEQRARILAREDAQRREKKKRRNGKADQ